MKVGWEFSSLTSSDSNIGRSNEPLTQAKLGWANITSSSQLTWNAGSWVIFQKVEKNSQQISALLSLK